MLLFGIIANLFYTVAQFIDVNNSEELNLPFYVSLTLIVPAMLIFIFDRVKLGEIKQEFKNIDKMAMLATSISWGIMIVFGLRAYQLERVSIVAPLLSLTVILNVIVRIFFLKRERQFAKKNIISFTYSNSELYL